MKKSHLIFLAILFLVLLGIATENLWKGFIFPQEKNPVAAAIDFSSLAAHSQDSIRIKTGNEEYVLQKNNEQWMAGDFQASSEEVASFFASLGETKLGEVVSQNPDHHNKFGLSPEESTEIALGENTLIIGKSADQMNSFYIKRSGENEVYLAKGSLREKVFRGKNAWRDKTLIDLSEQEPVKITFETKNAFTLEKKGEEWTLLLNGESLPADSEKIKALMDDFSPLAATGFLSDEEIKEYDASQEKERILFSFASGKEERIECVPRDAVYWAKSSLSPSYFTLSTVLVDSLFPNPEKLQMQKEETPPEKEKE